MSEEFKKFIKDMELLGFVHVDVPIPSDYDIDKVYIKTLDNKEEIAYRRINDIANKNRNNLKWDIAIKHLTEDVLLISDLIKKKEIKHPEKIVEFVTNCCAIHYIWDNKYKSAFNVIEDFKKSYKIPKTPKSIDEMDADELREYIKKHKI